MVRVVFVADEKLTIRCTPLKYKTKRALGFPIKSSEELITFDKKIALVSNLDEIVNPDRELMVRTYTPFLGDDY